MPTKNATRREFLGAGAKLVVGAALGGGALGMVAGCQESSTASTTSAAKGNEPEIPQWPWPYVALDPQAVAEKGYEGFYQGACAFGSFNAIISQLREKVGYPYTLLPTEMLKFGEGGVVGWATLCGTLTGSSAAINLVAKDYGKIVDELMGWYSTASLPGFQPSKPRANIQAKSVSGSPLCHVSVTEWCKTAGFKSESPERADRCARLAGEVAAHAVELLNRYNTGTFATTYTAAASIKTCGGCHLKGGTIENARGKMDCVQCHDPHQ